MSINPQPRASGFSLVELLIVILLVGVIAAIAIPNLMTSRRAVNEGSAIADLRTYHSAQITYASTIGRGDFAGDTSLNGDALTELGAAGIIDTLLAAGLKNGYRLTGVKIDASGPVAAGFCGRAVPVVGAGVTATGPRNIAISTNGVLYGGHAANPNSANCTVTGNVVAVTGGTPVSE